MGLALLAGLRTHQERRTVTDEERRRVYSAVARFQLQRAMQHRYLDGGLGRWRGTALDVFRACLYQPAAVLQPNMLLQVLAALLLPSPALARVRDVLLARRYGRT
jgi:hypothetical protein